MKFLSRSSLALAAGLVAASVVGFAGNAQAQNYTGNTKIDVDVKGILNLTDGTSDQPYEYSATTNTVPAGWASVGNLNVRSNQKDGFNIKVKSSNSDALGLKGAVSGNTGRISYQVRSIDALDGANTALTVTPSATDQPLFTSVDFNTLKCAASAGCNVEIEINIDETVLDQVIPDIYTDTLLYTLSAN